MMKMIFTKLLLACEDLRKYCVAPAIAEDGTSGYVLEITQDLRDELFLEEQFKPYIPDMRPVVIVYHNARGPDREKHCLAHKDLPFFIPERKRLVDA